jgi:hypothetical protein
MGCVKVRLDDLGSSPGREGNFILATASRPIVGPTEPPIQWVPGDGLSPDVKRPVCKFYHSPVTNVEIMNTWNYTSTPTYAFMM